MPTVGFLTQLYRIKASYIKHNDTGPRIIPREKIVVWKRKKKNISDSGGGGAVSESVWTTKFFFFFGYPAARGRRFLTENFRVYGDDRVQGIYRIT